MGETLRALLPMVSAKSDRTFLDAMLARQKEAVRGLNVYVDHMSKRTPMHPEPVAAALSEAAAPDAIFTADTGMGNVWSSRYIRRTRVRRLIGSFTHGSMANALPQSIGAQFAYPGRQVVAMCGDGGFTMSMGDLDDHAYNLPIKLIVFNNGALGMVKVEMEVAAFPLSNGLEESKLRKIRRGHRYHGSKNRKPGGYLVGNQEGASAFWSGIN